MCGIFYPFIKLIFLTCKAFWDISHGCWIITNKLMEYIHNMQLFCGLADTLL
jgi:hypothetical protein